MLLFRSIVATDALFCTNMVEENCYQQPYWSYIPKSDLALHKFIS